MWAPARGYEREVRAKGAGMRTHVLVALGAAMFMIVSQFGFEGASRFDAARVAAGSLGLAVGCGMYALSGICTVLILLFLEVLNSNSIKLGDKEVNAVFSSPDEEAIKNALTSLGRRVKDYSLSKQENGYKLEVVLHVPKKEYGVNLLTSLSSIPGVQLENFN